MEPHALAAPRSGSEFAYARLRRRVLVGSGVIGAVIAVAAVLVLRGVIVSWTRGEEVAVVASPNERYEVVVYRGADVIDPASVTWANAGTLVVATRQDTARVMVNVRSGKPASSSAPIWNWDC